MCIENSVGAGGDNERSDTAIIQVLLNYNRPAPLPVLAVDGRCGPGTIEAITEYQRRAMANIRPDGRVDPNGRTLAQLRAGLPHYDAATGPDATRLQGIMPLGAAGKITLYAPFLQRGMAARQIDTRLRQVHFLAQLGHESMSFVFAEEIASGDSYEGRGDLGNTQRGDGRRFKGRGLIQLTGRANYAAYGKAINRDLTGPGADATVVATEPALAVDVACWFWEQHGINVPADADDVIAVTRKVNGGLNGLLDRKAYLARARFFLT